MMKKVMELRLASGLSWMKDFHIQNKYRIMVCIIMVKKLVNGKFSIRFQNSKLLIVLILIWKILMES